MPHRGRASEHQRFERRRTWPPARFRGLRRDHLRPICPHDTHADVFVDPRVIAKSCAFVNAAH